MGRYRKRLSGVFIVLAMILLILDSRTALLGAKEGIELCLYTVIPSIFPFLILSNIINTLFMGRKISGINILGRWLGIPEGGESLFVLGVLGGYPVGAQAIYDTYQRNQMDRDTARRLLGFCSNAGPAFIFGMVASLFSSHAVAWISWGIQLIAAIVVGLWLPNKKAQVCRMQKSKPLTLSRSLDKSIPIMAAICGWVILFRVVIHICKRWFLWLFPGNIAALFVGFLELSNGCFELKSIASEGARFVLSNGFLSFGGICVGMQTVSATKELGTGMYFPGKILQCVISVILAGTVQHLLFSKSEICKMSIIVWIFLLFAAGLCMFFLYRKKKVVAICP